MELVDVADSKSADGDIMWVRVPPPAPRKTRRDNGGFCYCTPQPNRTKFIIICYARLVEADATNAYDIHRNQIFGGSYGYC